MAPSAFGLIKEILTYFIFSFGYFPGVKLTPGKYPKENIQYSNRGESLKSRKILTYFSLVLFTDHLSSNHSSYETNMTLSGIPLWFSVLCCPTCAKYAYVQSRTYSEKSRKLYPYNSQYFEIHIIIDHNIHCGISVHYNALVLNYVRMNQSLHRTG